MEVLYLFIAIAIIIALFVVFKRPMYEAVFITFLFICIISGNLHNLGKYIVSVSSNYLLFAILAFIGFSVVLEKTGIIYDFINLIAAFVGRFSGGAGYVALLASAGFGALSGTGPGNAAAVGVIAIPSMKKSGFSSELAATVEMAASSLGPVIPPSGTVNVTFAMVCALYPNCCTFSQYWVLMWGISLWFILERLVTLFILIKKEHVQPIPKEERLSIPEALKKGWAALLLPIIIFIPFFLDSQFSSTLFTARLGAEGAAALTSTLLSMIPGLSIAYILLVTRKKVRIKTKDFMLGFRDAIEQVSPITVLVFSGFALSEVFDDIGVGERISKIVQNASIPFWFVVIVVPLIFVFLGMFLECMSMVMLFGTTFIILCASVGINPILASAMINLLTGGICHMTPPFALCFFVCMGIAESDFMKTTKMAVLWCVGHYIFCVLILAGILPILGNIPFSF